MKRLSMIMVCLFAMMAASLSAKAQEVTITLKPGWTWIGYPSTDTVDFATALGTFTPREGDMIACEYDFSEYFDGDWFGDIQHFYPGYGYMYYSTRAMPVMLTFNTQPPTPQLTVTTAEPTEITANSAVSGGSITSNNGNYIYVFMKGICWTTHPNPMVMNDSYTESGSGAESFTAEMTDLSPNTEYYVRAYAVTLEGTFYGDEISFTTLDHEYVDLGLPSGTLWATCNVGAGVPEDYGDYFAWGETQAKTWYDWSTYQYCNGSETTLTKYCTDASYGYHGFTDYQTTLLPEDDAVMANWGNEWRMPTMEEWQELRNNTTHTWVTRNGVLGGLFTASNGNSLFLPAAGMRIENGIEDDYYDCCYWSDSLTLFSNRAWCFEDSGSILYLTPLRYAGLSVRAVRSVSQNNAPLGAIDGKFTINDNGDRVYFSQGNLQYQASTNTWKFSEHQYDYVGDDNSNISPTNEGWIDLFGWGTSGYNHGANCYLSWSTSTDDNDYYVYGGSNYNLYDQTRQADWGYNPISNGGNIANLWRTLTANEWDFLFNTRNTISGIRYAKAQVNGNNGVILLPDDWSTSYYTLNNTNSITSGYNSNIISASQWEAIEDEGAVFLPSAGARDGLLVTQIGSGGWYWSGSYGNNECAQPKFFIDGVVSSCLNKHRHYGMSVRLVQDYQ